MLFHYQLKSNSVFVWFLFFLVSCNQGGGQGSGKLSIVADTGSSSYKEWQKDKIKSNYALFFRASDYQQGLSLEEELNKSFVFKLSADYTVNPKLPDRDGAWVAQVRGYEESDIAISELSQYGVYQSAISSEFHFRKDGNVTEVAVQARKEGYHFPVSGQLAVSRISGTSCSFQVNVSGDETKNLGSRGYLVDVEAFDADQKLLQTLKDSSLQFSLSGDDPRKLKVSLKVQTGIGEQSEVLVQEEISVNCDPFLVASLQTLKNPSNETYTLSPLLLETKTALQSFATASDADQTCSDELGKLLVSKDHFATCDPIDVIKTTSGKYLVLPKRQWDSNQRYSLGVIEKAGNPAVVFGSHTTTPLIFQTRTQVKGTSLQGLDVALAEIKQNTKFSLTREGLYRYEPASGKDCNTLGGIKHTNQLNQSFAKVNVYCEIAGVLRDSISNVSVAVHGSRLKVSWNAIAGRTYNIYRDTSQTGSFSTRFTSPTSSYLDTNASASQVYYYQVAACLDSACSAKSSPVKASASLTPSHASATQVQNKQTSVQLKWDAPSNRSGVQHYKIYRQKADGTWELVHTTSDAGTTTWKDTGLTQSQTYSYQISAVTADDSEFYLSSFSVTLKNKPDTPQITNVAKTSETSIQVKWNAVPRAEDYEVIARRRSVGSSSYGVHTVYNGANISYTHTSLALGQAYSYKVKACNIAGCSVDATSNEIVLIPSSPTSLAVAQVSGSETKATLTWNAPSSGVSGLQEYKIYRSTSSSGGYAIAHSGTTVTTWTDTGLTRGTTYYYKVSAVNIGGESAQSTSASVALQRKPAVPTGLSVVQVQNSETSATLTWTAPTGVSGLQEYKIYRSTTSGSGYAIAHSGTTVTTWTDTGLTRGRTYYYQVSAVNIGGESAASTVVNVVLKNKPSAPTTISVTADKNGMQLSWSAVSGATQYDIWRNTTGSYSKIATVNTTSKTDVSFLSANTSYTYQVKACNIAGCSAFSSPKSATSVNMPSSKVSNFSGSSNSSGTRITLRWSNDGAATYYRIYRTGVGVRGNSHSTFYTDGTTPSVTYTYTIYSCNIVGCSTAYESATVTSSSD